MHAACAFGSLLPGGMRALGVRPEDDPLQDTLKSSCPRLHSKRETGPQENTSKEEPLSTLFRHWQWVWQSQTRRASGLAAVLLTRGALDVGPEGEPLRDVLCPEAIPVRYEHKVRQPGVVACAVKKDVTAWSLPAHVGTAWISNQTARANVVLCTAWLGLSRPFHKFVEPAGQHSE